VWGGCCSLQQILGVLRCIIMRRTVSQRGIPNHPKQQITATYRAWRSAAVALQTLPEVVSCENIMARGPLAPDRARDETLIAVV